MFFDDEEFVKKVYILTVVLTSLLGMISSSTEGMLLNKDGKYNEQNQAVCPNSIRPYLRIRKETIKRLKDTSLVTANYTCGDDDNTLHVRNFFQNFYYTVEGWYIENLIFDSSNSFSKIPDRRIQKERPLCDCKTVKQVVVPTSFTKIGSKVFLRFTNLKSISISNVIEIGEAAFEGCTELQSVLLSPELKRIADHTFECCENLKKIAIPEKVTCIGAYAFYRTGLKSISIPKNVKEIGYNAFSGAKLEQVLITSKSTAIGAYAFSGSNLREVSIPSTEINQGAFSYCKKLRSVHLSSELRLIANNTFEHCKSLKRISIPESVTSIGRSAFYLSGLTCISVPMNVTNIDRYCTFYCESLVLVEFLNPNAKHMIRSSAFYSDPSKLVILIPFEQ